MSDTTTVNAKIDESLKKRAQETADELGLPLSAVIRAQLETFVREKRVEFSVGLEPNEETKQILREAQKDLENGENITGPLATSEEVQDYLDSLKQ
jgi:addiction module RelB/DinJ family antitoxin